MWNIYRIYPDYITVVVVSNIEVDHVEFAMHGSTVLVLNIIKLVLGKSKIPHRCKVNSTKTHRIKTEIVSIDNIDSWYIEQKQVSEITQTLELMDCDNIPKMFICKVYDFYFLLGRYNILWLTIQHIIYTLLHIIGISIKFKCHQNRPTSRTKLIYYKLTKYLLNKLNTIVDNINNHEQS